jgi:acetyl-CoA C-acetyltransferase
MRDVVIVAAARTAVGCFQGAFAQVSAVNLGAIVMRAVLDRSGFPPRDVDEVVFGHVLTAGLGQNTARQAAIHAGLPIETTAVTLNKVCGSGLKAVQLAAQAIQAGDAEAIIAGGMENMSQAPYLLPGARTGWRMGDAQAVDSMILDGLTDAFDHQHMGITAENLATRHGITREQQDEYAWLSQQRAQAAVAAGRFEAEIVSVAVPQRKGDPLQVRTDEQPRVTDLAALSKLRPAFQKNGSVTAGNASSLNDGAAAVLLTSAERAQALGLPVLARIAASASAGVEPAYMGEGPIPATRKCLDRAGWPLESVDLIEANEAFAAQALTVRKVLGFDPQRVNVNGGAIALGHPIGASGCRVLVTLIHELKRQNLRRGLATLCIGGGQGIAMAIER